MTKPALAIATVLLAAASTACERQAGADVQPQPDDAHRHQANQPAEPDIDRGVAPIDSRSPLVAVLRPIGDSNVAGTVRFTHHPDGVRVVAEVTGLDADAAHGFHVHAFGDASDLETGASAGVHFNPFGTDHALPGHNSHTDSEHAHAGPGHVGDFPNLVADAQGHATADFVQPTIALTEGPAAILGRSVIIHEGEDIGAQPWGGAGPRIAIGIIGLAHPDTTGSD